MNFDVFLNSVLLGFLAILICVLFFNITRGYINDIVVIRLTKASFSLDLVNIFDLWISYCVSSFIIIWIYFYIPQQLDPYAYVMTTSNEFLAALALIIIYLGRLFTRYEGKASGKAYYVTIITYALIRIIFLDPQINIINISAVNMSTIISSYEEYFMYIKEITPPLIFYALLFSTFGELILSMTPYTSTQTWYGFMESFIYPTRGEILDSPQKVKQRTPLQAAGHVRAGHQLFEF